MTSRSRIKGGSGNSIPSLREVRVMIVGPGLRTEGGITEVIDRINEEFKKWSDISVYWVETHRSGNVMQKISQLLIGLVCAIRRLPRISIVHIHSSANVSFIRKTLFYWLARIWHRPIIWHLHTPNDDFSGFFGRRDLLGKYARFVLGHCDRIIVLSDSWVKLAATVVPREKLCVIYNPIPAIATIGDAAVPVNAVRILYLAHLIQRKGYPLLIQAFAAVLRKYPEIKLVFAGSGEVEEAQQMCTELGIRRNVEFLGWVGRAVRSQELQSANIFVLPSYQEGLPMGLLEAMAYGLAVITTPVGGVPDIIQHGLNGRLIPTGDAEALSCELLTLIEDPKECLRLGMSARTSVQNYTPEVIARRWLKLYRCVLSSIPDKAST